MALGTGLGDLETMASPGADRPPRRWPRWVAAGLLLAAGLALGADRLVAAGEQERLLAAVRDGGAAVSQADARIAGMVAYTSPLLVSTRVSPQLREDLRALVRDAAGDGAADVRAAREAVLDVGVMPWHGSAAAARDIYAAYLEDRLDRLEVVAASYPQGLAGDGGAALSSARDALRAAYGDAGAAAAPAPAGEPGG